MRRTESQRARIQPQWLFGLWRKKFWEYFMYDRSGEEVRGKKKSGGRRSQGDGSLDLFF